MDFDLLIKAQRPEFLQDEPVPAASRLAGWSALVHHFGISAPIVMPSCVSDNHIHGNRRMNGIWSVFDKRYAPDETFEGHIVFALRHENMDMLALKRILEAVPERAIADIVIAAPVSSIARRIWFYFETLTGRLLDIDDAPRLTAVPALDKRFYFTGKERLSTRHRVRDNLLGTGDFCPIIRRTEKLQSFVDLKLSEKAQETIGRVGKQLIARAASFLLLADSRASFEIENERAPTNRLERWGRAVLQAGERPLNQAEIYRLHSILIGSDNRFIPVGFREDAVFLGDRDHNNNPLPEFVGARPDDIPCLMSALFECNARLRATSAADLDPVLQAAAIAFGFVYIHPLADGNGRMHRCLIHNVLAERGFTPPGLVFPVSTVMLERIKDYRNVLQGHSAPLMDLIHWRALPNGNVHVSNDTSDLYRYFDCTSEAEFLYECVMHTVEYSLPREIDFLTCHDTAMSDIMNFVEMPDRMAEELIILTRQNNGLLSRKRRKKHPFDKLKDAEIKRIEQIISDAFGGFKKWAERE